MSESLPIHEYKEDLIEAIKEYNLLVIIGETGSGKTTQIPQYILDSIPNVKSIAVTQPRRIAAITVARRVSEERHCRLGDEVGYAIRFDDCTSSATKLKYLTDGLLLREATLDPYLRAYDVIIVDEAHERTVETDVLFGLLKQTHRLRPEVKILIMSATLNVDKFSDFFETCPVFSIPGRTYDVTVRHHRDAKLSTLRSNYTEKCVEIAAFIHKNEPPGDVLVFLTGQREIDQACKEMRELERRMDYKRDVRYYPEVQGVTIYPIHSSLETFEQKAIFQDSPRGLRKIVFATNIAQTSVTIPGIRYVVDSGFVKQKTYDPNTGMDALLVTEISQAAATQRAGRAGRTQEGKAYRLYSHDAFTQLEPETIPEIQRSSLLSTTLALKRIGIIDILNFEFIDPPDPNMVRNALRQLYLLGAIDELGELTHLGRWMSNFPLSPYLSRCLWESKKYGCLREMLIIVAMLSSEDVLITPSNEEKQAQAAARHRRFWDASGDHITLLRVYRAWKKVDYDQRWCRENFMSGRALNAARNVRSQLEALLDRYPIEEEKEKKEPAVGEKETRRSEGMEYSEVGKESDEDQSRKRAKHERQDANTRESDLRRHERSYDRGRKSEKSYERERGSDKVDAVAIIKSLLSAFFPHLSKRHPNLPIFYNYALSSNLSTSTTDSSSALLALNIHPQSALSLDLEKGRLSDIEWVVYHQVMYTTRAIMKFVSRVQFEWVEEVGGLERWKGLKNAALSGVEQKDREDRERIARVMQAEKERRKIEEEERRDQRVKAKVEEERRMQTAAVEDEQRQKREKAIEAARQRALSRRKEVEAVSKRKRK
ncbi:uncharacterized protein VTP21DRAFT_3262 [Calcarisporiella thermophila]|uniref:uncharacterized protein n=1 Tax=Calcarisporiella thermophila TaxID=911321 RepID=UPI0037422EF0